MDWGDYREQCNLGDDDSNPGMNMSMNPHSGEIVMTDSHWQIVPSVTGEIGIVKLDPLAAKMSRLFDTGMLVSIDRLSRIPPLEAPVKPEWLGVESFRKTGVVRSQTSFKVSPFDEAVLKRIEKLRTATGDLLPHYSFALSDGVRWMPKKAMPLFEAALSTANEEIKSELGREVGEDLTSFLMSQKQRIHDDAQLMFEQYHPGQTIPESSVTRILDELKSRLAHTQGGTLIPKVAYSPITFNPAQSTEWSSPWSQALQLVKSIALFPRAAMTDRFFWNGIPTEEADLIDAMNVAGDCLVENYGSRKAWQRAKRELAMIKRIDAVDAAAKDKCQALWALLTQADEKPLKALLGEIIDSTELDFPESA
jgi:hypothetical protein